MKPRRRLPSRSHFSARLHLPLFLALLLAASVTWAQEPVDSAMVRTPEPPRKSVGDRLLDIPEELLRLPIRAVKGVVYGGIEAANSSATVARLVENAFSPAPITGLYPVASYGSNSGLVGGLGYRNFDLLRDGDRFDLRGSYSTHQYQRFRIRYESALPPNDHPAYIITLQYRKRPWEHFYGLGNDSRPEDRVAYTLEQTGLDASVRLPLGSGVAARARGAITADNIFDGQADHLVTNLDIIRESLDLDRDATRSTRYVSIGAGLEHDWRDTLGRPTHGGIERIGVTYNRGVGRSDDLEFFITEVEIQHFLNVFRKRTIAARLLIREVDRPDQAPSLPFYLRSGLGGEDDLRGFSRSRFVDNDLALLTVEWRYPVWRVVDGFIFVDEARVFSSLRDDFSFRGWHSSAGIGLRVWSERALHAKAMLAFGEEEPRLYLDLGAEF